MDRHGEEYEESERGAVCLYAIDPNTPHSQIFVSHMPPKKHASPRDLSYKGCVSKSILVKGSLNDCSASRSQTHNLAGLVSS